MTSVVALPDPMLLGLVDMDVDKPVHLITTCCRKTPQAPFGLTSVMTGFEENVRYIQERTRLS